MTQEESKKIIDLINSSADVKKCNDYYDKIIKGDYSCLEEAILFTINKYDELCITDTDIVLISNIRRIPEQINQDLVKKSLQNLQCIYILLVAKISKTVFVKNN